MNPPSYTVRRPFHSTPRQVIEWATDAYDTAHGWTLIYQPNYPEITMNTGTPMAQGASGLRLVPIYHANPTLTPLTGTSFNQQVRRR